MIINPSVSVILPTYNREKLLERAIRSVCLQTIDDLELIIIDDGSTDNTPQRIAGITDLRIKYLRCEQNMGQNHARNLGIEYSLGEYIAFLDSDDEWLPDFLQEVITKFRSNLNFGAVYSQAFAQKRNGERYVSHPCNLEGDVYRSALTLGYLSHMITLVVKKECIKQIGLFDETLTVCEDNDICLRIAKKNQFGLIQKPLAVIHEDAGEKRLIKDRIAYAEGWNRLISKFEKDIIDECGTKVLAKHLTQTGKYYLLAQKKVEATSAFKRAYRLHKSIRGWIYIIISELPLFVYRGMRKIMELFSDFRKPIGNQ
jgi:glycosyltransferase involved in cell wall biosynthesis